MSRFSGVVQNALFSGNTDVRDPPGHRLVAIRDVPSLNVAAGQRCIFSTIDREAQPPRITAVCGDQGEVAIRQPNWAGFERRPQEDSANVSVGTH